MRRLLAVFYYVTVMMVFTWEFASGHLQVAFDYYKIMILSTLGMACSLLMNRDPWTGSWSKKVIEPQSSPTGGIWDRPPYGNRAGHAGAHLPRA